MQRKQITEILVSDHEIFKQGSDWKADPEISFEDMLALMKFQTKGNPHHFSFKFSQKESYDYDCYDSSISIVANRWETDEELEKRTVRAEKATVKRKKKTKDEKTKKEQRELREYERLKKKFGLEV